MNDFCRSEKVLHSWRIRSGYFDLELLGVGFAALKTQAAAGNIFTIHDVVPMSETADARLKVHLRAHVFPPVFPARGWRGLRRRSYCNGSGRRFLFIFIHPAHGAALHHLHENRSLLRILGPAFPEGGRPAVFAKPDNPFVDAIDIRFQVALLDGFARPATATL